MDKPVFCTSKGTPVHPRNFNRKFYQLREIAGVPEDVNLHALKHTFATRMPEMGEDLKIVQELLGHARISVTADTYTHVSPELKYKAADKMDCHLRTFVTKMSPKKGSKESLEP